MSSPASVVAKHRGTSPSYLVKSGIIIFFSKSKTNKNMNISSL